MNYLHYKFNVGDTVCLKKEMCSSFSWDTFGNLPGTIIYVQEYGTASLFPDYLVRFDLGDGNSKTLFFDERAICTYEEENEEDIQTCDINDLFDIK